MSSRLRWSAIVILAWALVGVPAGHARQANQTAQKSALSGVVTDSAGGVIPGVTVIVTNVATGAAMKATTNGAGVWLVQALDPGTYEVTISLQGFKTVKLTSVVLRAGTTTSVGKVALEIGAMEASVQVTASTQLVETTNTGAQATVSGDYLTTMPLTTKNGLNFVTFLPGVGAVGTPAQRSSTIMGLTGSQISIYIDGVNVNDAGNRGDSSFITFARPGTDQVQEIVVSEGRPAYGPQTASYERFIANPFYLTTDQPLSTFAADVDTASYTNVRRFLSKGELPPPDAVRIEELINYFRFAYPDPAPGRPVSITTEIGDCPWAPSHKLALIGLRAKPIDDRDVRGRNITLLLDVSGSMEPPERLPLIKTAMRMWVDTLRDEDRVAIVVYAGASGLALPATRGRDRQRIHDAIENLHAGGSTNGADGLRLAYQVARENFIAGGINRVILATDDDFNVGVTSHDGLLALIERERETGVFLSVLGVGTNNLKDATMSMLADKGNGHYAYLDSLQAARRVLVQEGGATLETVAKDVKLQVEFNPAQVGAYRLLGYEKRLLAARDFNDDRKDGGEMGAGHTVTALYELLPADAAVLRALRADGGRPEVDPLKYQPIVQKPVARPVVLDQSAEWLTVKVRYKLPDGDTSTLMEQAVTPGRQARHLALASAVAEFGMLLRDPLPQPARWDGLVGRLTAMSGGELAADRASFAELVEAAAGLKKLIKR
jgi:Ca-activated chloride channel family protein